MKHNTTSKSLTALILAASASSLCAIERPTPAEQPKEKPAAQEKPLAMPEAKVALRPYLGVMGAPVSEAMATQLGLADGIGVTLQHVARNTPAEKAGLKKHDIITQIGGQDIGNQMQLRNAILKQKPNAKVELKYISGGKAITKQVELGAYKQPRAMRGQGQEQGPAVRPHRKGQVIPRGALPKDVLENLPPAQRKQLEQLLQGNLNKLDFRNLDNLDVDQLQKHFKGFGNQQRLELNLNDLMKNGGGNTTRMKMVDPEGSVTLETDGDKKNIELHDTDGKLLYKGPFNTKEDKLKIPENLRERANKMQIPEFRMLRKGKKQNIKPQGPKLKLNKGIEQLLENELNGIELPEELKKLMKQGNAKGFVFPQNGLELPEELKQLMKQGNAKGLQLPQGGQMQKFEFNLNGGKGTMKSSSTMVDPATGHRYTQRENKDGKEVEIKDKAGKLLFSGPYNSSSDHEMVPEEYRPFLKKLGSFKLFNNNLKKNLELKAQPKK